MIRILLAFFTSLHIIGCSAANDDVTDVNTPGDQTDFPGTITELSTGLVSPWGLAFLLDGSVLVSSRTNATIHRIPATGGTPQLVGIVPDVSFTAEGGLLGLVASPTFDQDRSVYAYLSAQPSNKIVRLTISEDYQRLEITAVLLEGITTANRHHGGRLAIGTDGHLWITTGDAFTPEVAQNLNSLNGKILRIALDGSIPAGNMGNTPIYSYGHRNVQGITFAPDGTVYASELGHRTWDELNVIRPGENYGWPQAEGIAGDLGVRPLAVFHPDDCSPAGLAYAKGSLWMGALGGQRLYQIQVNNGAMIGQPISHWIRRYGRIRTVEVAPDGALWILTSNRDGATWGGTPPREGDDRLLRVVLN